MPRALGKEISTWMKVITLLVSATSSISAIQRTFDIGLTSVFYEYISYYRRLYYPLVEFLPKMIHITLPAWYKDLYAISFILCSIACRALVDDEIKKEAGFGFPLLVFALSGVLSIILFGFWGVFAPLVMSLFTNKIRPELTDKFLKQHPAVESVALVEIPNNFVVGLGCVIVASVLFFAANAYFS